MLVRMWQVQGHLLMVLRAPLPPRILDFLLSMQISTAFIELYN